MAFYRMHREGYGPTAVTLLVLLVVVLALYFGLPKNFRWIAHCALGLAGLVLGLVLHFFRNPTVAIAPDERAVLAPCEGKVVLIEEVLDRRYFDRPMRQISLFMSPLNVHVNRTPVGGKVVHLEYQPGKYLVAWHPKSSELNEHTYLVVDGPYGPVGFKQIAGAVARRIRWYVSPGDHVTQGQEFGFIRFGSRCDVLIPLDWKVTVAMGDKTSCGSTVLARVP